MEHHLDELVHFSRASAHAGLLSSTCGNASLRIDADRMVITASGAPLAALTHAQISVVALADGKALSGPRPSAAMPGRPGRCRAPRHWPTVSSTR